MYMALRYSTVAFTFCLLANKITYLHIIQKHHSSFFFSIFVASSQMVII